MNLIEKILWGSFLILVLFRIKFEIPFILILFLGMMLSTLYFYFSLLLINGIKISSLLKKSAYKGLSSQKILASILAGIVYSILSIAITFKALAWPGASFLLYLSFIGLVIIFFTFTKKHFTKTNIYRGIRARNFILLTISIIFIGVSLLPVNIQKNIFPMTTNTPSEVEKF